MRTTGIADLQVGCRVGLLARTRASGGVDAASTAGQETGATRMRSLPRQSLSASSVHRHRHVQVFSAQGIGGRKRTVESALGGFADAVEQRVILFEDERFARNLL